MIRVRSQTGGAKMSNTRQYERRSPIVDTPAQMRARLNENQRVALADLERFGWELKFVRHPLFRDAVPVVFDAERRHYGTLDAAGRLDERPAFDIRFDSGLRRH